jgi:putative glycosyltransferase (TIGR04348 family)
LIRSKFKKRGKISMSKPAIVLVSPGLPDARNGNWQTAHRWASMLSPSFDVILADQWPNTATKPVEQAHLLDPPSSSEKTAPVAMLALHAYKSSTAIEAWSSIYPNRPLIVVLTGTDLYRDIKKQPQAQASIERADYLVVLQEEGPKALPVHLRSKCRVIFQSCSSFKTLAKTTTHLKAVMVGHLRDEKWPQTLFEAASQLSSECDRIYIDHIGRALDSTLGQQALSTASQCSNYRWLGSLSHRATRHRIQHAHVLIHTSRMEGGAHAVMEAVRSGTPVLASKIDGNLGMLGLDYLGYFEPGDSRALCLLLQRCREEQAMSSRLQAKRQGLLATLEEQCSARAALFEPEVEKAALLSLLSEATR